MRWVFMMLRPLSLPSGSSLRSLRGIDTAARAMTAAPWIHGHHMSLADRSVLIIGAMGVVAGVSGLPELLAKADVAVLTVPLTIETKGLLNSEFLARMRDDSLLVNIARGSVVKTDDLVADLSWGRFRAALNVTDPEQLPVEHPQWRCPNMLITGHLGGNTISFPPRAVILLTEQLRRWRAGEPAFHVVAGVDLGFGDADVAASSTARAQNPSGQRAFRRGQRAHDAAPHRLSR